MTNLGELQTMSAWAEDRALLRSTPSADPGAKTGARAERNCSALCSIPTHDSSGIGTNSVTPTGRNSISR